MPSTPGSSGAPESSCATPKLLTGQRRPSNACRPKSKKRPSAMKPSILPAPGGASPTPLARVDGSWPSNTPTPSILTIPTALAVDSFGTIPAGPVSTPTFKSAPKTIVGAKPSPPRKSLSSGSRTNAEIVQRKHFEKRFKEFISGEHYADALRIARHVVEQFPQSPQARALRDQIPVLEKRVLGERTGSTPPAPP